MKYRKFHTSNPPDTETETQNNKHNKLPFLRASNPVKRCPEPSEDVSEDKKEDPFSHLLHANGVNSDQSTNPHGEAFRSLGSLAGQRVCRGKPSNFSDAVLNCHTGVNVLPPFNKLVSKKRGPKRKQKTVTDGPWKYVDEHVAQLRRKASYLNRTEEKVTEAKPVQKQEPKADMKPTRDLTKPPHSQDDMASSSCIADIFNEIKGAICSAHQANGSITLRDNSTLASVPSTSDLLPSTSRHVKGPPAWKPVLVVGKSPGISVDEKIPMQEWNSNVEQETPSTSMTRNSPGVSRTPLTNPITPSTHEQDPSNVPEKFEFNPQVGENSFQRVPGSANLDINGLSSPWLNMWSPSPKTEKNEE